MARFLFVVPPLAGHTNPTVSVARILASRGHQVAWAAHANRVRPLLPDGAEIHDLGDAADDPAFLARAREVRGLESLQFLWQDFLVPLARAMRSPVEAAIRAFAPDLVIVDQQAIGGALAARRLGVRFATFCSTSADLVDPLAALPRVRTWVDAQLAALEAEAGLPSAGRPDLSPHGIIVFSTPALAGDTSGYPAACRFVGPSIADRPDATPFPWDALLPGPRLLLSLGTVNAERGEGFFRAAAAALGDWPGQVIVVAPDGMLPSPPPRFLVRPRVPQLALLGHVDAVVCHAGHNTVCEALAHALPLVVAPIKDDQPVIADQVVRAGCGLRVRFGRLDPASLRHAVDRVLAEPAFRAAAARVRDSFRAAGGAATAAGLLEELLPVSQELSA